MLRKCCQSGLIWLWVTAVVIGLDRFTKQLALKNLLDYTPVEITSFFNLTLSYNKGAAFGFLNSASGWQMWMFGSLAVLVGVTLLVWLARLPRQQAWISIALSLVIGGAAGNLIDRIYYGRVIDFIQWHVANYYWPTFNIADSAICAGAVMLLIDALLQKKQHK